MDNTKLDRIIEAFRNLKEDGAAVPTMNTGSTAGKAGFGGSAQGFDPGPTAGFDPKMGSVRKRYAKGGKDSRKKWLEYLRNQTKK